MPRFFDDDAFDEGFEQELVDADSVEASILGHANPVFARQVFDVTFVSNDTKKLVALAKELTGMGYRMQKPTRGDDGPECSGTSMPLPVAEGTVLCWAIDLYCRGFEFDCKLVAYGALSDFSPPETKSGKQLFAEAMAAYERGNRGLAIALFSMALAVEPDNPNTWYSRACIVDDIHLWKRARRDYDKAIELAPRFTSALVNRGANKDAADEYDDAIADYDRAIAIDNKNEAAFLNRGNSKFNKGDKAGAIADWKIAANLGSATAKKRLADHR